MAGEYFRWKYRDVKPGDPAPEPAGKEKLANRLRYHKWWIVVWAFLLFSVGSTI